MKSVIITCFAISSFLFVFEQKILACSCDLPARNISLKQQIKHAKKKADAVFAGEVLEVRDDKFSRVVQVRVITKWKGVKDSDIIIFTGKGGGDCGYLFEVGEKYLIYAFETTDKKLSTNICQRTNLLAEAQNDLTVLNKK